MKLYLTRHKPSIQHPHLRQAVNHVNTIWRTQKTTNQVSHANRQVHHTCTIHTLYPHQVHNTSTTVTHSICTKFITPAQYSHTLSTPSSSHLHNIVIHPICTKFITPTQYSHTPYLYQVITPAQYSHTPYLYRVHHTCTIQSHTLSVPSSFCQKCKWQVTAKHAYTLRMWLCMKWHGAWLYGVHRMHRDGSSFMWHQPCQRCKYTTSVDIQKRAIEDYSLM